MRRFFLCLLALALFFGGQAPAWAAPPTCAACGGEIAPGRYVIDQWKTSYHTHHATIHRCVFCARGISPFNTGGGGRDGSGRDVCNICRQSAVVDVETAVQLAESVRERMGRWGLRFGDTDIPIHLAGAAGLEGLYGRSHERHEGILQGVTSKKWTSDQTGRVVGRTVSITMLDGLPQEVFEKTMAHELMHAWMFLDQQPEHGPALEEGACNLAAYYLLQENTSEFAGLMREGLYRSKDPVYGAGLRRAIRYVQAHQFAGLVKLLRSGKDFPAGE